MSGRQARVAWGIVFAFCLLLCVTISTGQTQQASPRGEKSADGDPIAVETLLPARSVIYMGWQGSQTHEDAWHQTAAYQSLYETGLSDLMRKLVVFILQQSGTNSGDVLPIIDQISAHGVSLSIALPEAGPPLPQALVVIHGGQHLFAPVDAFIRRAVGGDLKIMEQTRGERTISSVLVPNSPGVEFAWWKEGAHLVLAGGIAIVDSTLAVAQKQAPNITANPLWARAAQAPAGRVISLASWVDFAALRETYGEMSVPNPNPQAPPIKVNQILDALGLSELGPLVYQSGYAGPALWSETTLSAPEPRTGLLAPWSYGSVTLEDLPPMPEGISGFYARSLDWSTMHDAIIQLLRNAAQLGPPEASGQLEQALAEVDESLGLNLKRDLFDPLGDVICLYADQTQSLMGFGAVLAAKVDDAARLRTTLTSLLLRLSAESRGQVGVRVVSKYGRELAVLQMAGVPFTPAICVDDEWLIIGLTSQALETFLLRADGQLPTWEPSPEHQAGLELIEDDFAAISITDPRDTMRTLVSLAPMILSLVQMEMRSQQLPMPIRAEEIPPSELITAPLFPNVSVCTAEDDVIRWRSRTSIPSVPIMTSFGGGSGVAVTGTLIALLLPAVQQARMAARRTQSKNNLKQIGLAMHNYHDVHKTFPPGTHPNDNLEVDERFSWMAEILPFIDQAALFNQLEMDQAWDSQANSDFTNASLMVYQNPNLPEEQVPGSTNYVGLAGVGEDAPMLPADHKRAGVFGYNRATKIQSISDGTSNTIAVSESSSGKDRWAEGGKSTIRALTQKPYIGGPDGLGGSFPGGCNMLFCDGSVRFLSENIDPTLLEHLTTIAGGEAAGGF